MTKRFAVLADVHGNLPALEAVLNNLPPVDGIWALGDLTGGPGQNEVVRRLRALCGATGTSYIIRGNNEDYMLDYELERTRGRRVSRQWAPLQWAYGNLDSDLLDFLTGLPTQQVCVLPSLPPVRLVHGSPRRAREPLFPDRDAERMQRFKEAGFFVEQALFPLGPVLAQMDEAVLACGHTHIPWVQRDNGKLAFNPGSVGGPIDGDRRAQYALLAWDGREWQVELRAVAYDLERVRQAFVESGYLEASGVMGRALLVGMESGQNVMYALLMAAFRLAAEAGLRECTVVPDDILERAAVAFDWERAARGEPPF